MSVVRVVPVGPDAVLAEVETAEEALSLYAAARRHGADGGAGGPLARDIVPAARTVLFDGVRDRADLAAFLDQVRRHGLPDAPPGIATRIDVPTVYDGEDLDLVARHWGMTRDEVVGTHTGLDLVVAFCGFAPGFPYVAGLPEELAVPRRTTPRVRVPAGSVALAGRFTGIYPTDSPGGWLLLGRTALSLWDAGAEQPATLAPGTVVRFVAVSR